MSPLIISTTLASPSLKMTTLVIALNGLLILFTLALTYGLWRCKQALNTLNRQLQQMTLNPQQLRYAIALKRVQLAETRLGVSTWQKRSKQINQTLQLIQLLRWLLLYRRRPLLPRQR